MTIPEILKELTPYTGHFPLQAMTAAIEQHDAITPVLLRVLEAVAHDPAAFAQKRDHSMLHLFAMYLVAQFRESRAYRPLVTMFSAPGETAFELAGDTVTERLKSIFGSVYDGAPDLLQGLVENDNANGYVRSAALDAFIVLVESGQMAREEVARYYRSLFEGKLKRTFSHAWSGLVTAVADLPAPELLGPVHQAFADGLVDGGFGDLEWIERTLQHPERRHREQYRIITDAIAEMEWWAAFNKDKRPRKPRQPRAVGLAGPLPQLPPSPPRMPPKPPMRVVKIGRNDPCPCGSGNKYKKCCGRN